jgi:hypothetical protein
MQLREFAASFGWIRVVILKTNRSFHALCSTRRHNVSSLNGETVLEPISAIVPLNTIQLSPGVPRFVQLRCKVLQFRGNCQGIFHENVLFAKAEECRDVGTPGNECPW